MSMSTFQKVTLVSCLVLCVSLLLPKILLSGGRRDAAPSDGPPGHFPPMLHRKSAPDAARGQRGHFSRAHNPEAIARAKGSMAAGGKSNLAGQIIPVYGFGILLYILYIIFKITSRGKTTMAHEGRFPSLRSENTKRKITDFELAQLQERLKETEEVMESMVSRAQAQHHSPKRAAPVTVAQEEALLLQLKEITRVMQEGRLVDGIPAQKVAVEPDHEEDWADEGSVLDCGEETRSCWNTQDTEGREAKAAHQQHRDQHEDEETFCCRREDPGREEDPDCAHGCVWNEVTAARRDEDEELADESLQVLSAFGTETETFEKVPHHLWNTSPSHHSLIRRKKQE